MKMRSILLLMLLSSVGLSQYEPSNEPKVRPAVFQAWSESKEGLEYFKKRHEAKISDIDAEVKAIMSGAIKVSTKKEGLEKIAALKKQIGSLKKAKPDVVVPFIRLGSNAIEYQGCIGRAWFYNPDSIRVRQIIDDKSVILAGLDKTLIYLEGLPTKEMGADDTNYKLSEPLYVKVDGFYDYLTVIGSGQRIVKLVVVESPIKAKPTE